MRSLLFIPLYDQRVVSSKKYLEWASKADGLIFDFEDSLSPELKNDGRKLLIPAIEHFSGLNKTILVRVNSTEVELRADLEIIRKSTVRKIIFPKIKKGIDLNWWNKDDQFEIFPLIETAQSLLNLNDILSQPSVKGCFFGPEDLMSEINRFPTIFNTQYAAAQVVLTAAALGLPAFGNLGPIGLFGASHREKMADAYRLSKELGFQGAFAVHHSQLESINAAFVESDLDRNKWERILNRETKNAVFAVDGEMFGPPMISRIKKLLGR